MKNIIRFAGAIFVLLGIAWYTYEKRPSNGQTYDDCAQDAHIIAKYEHHGADIAVEGLSISPVEDTERREYHRKKYLQQTVTCKSLKSQWATADTAHYAFWAGIVGLVLIALTLVVTGVGVEVARRASKSETRAYLMVDGFDPNTAVTANHISFVIIVKNFGNTPASDVSNKVHFLFSQTANERILNKSEGRSGSNNKVPPNKGINIPAIITKPRIREHMTAGKVRFTFCIEITYDDIFGETAIEVFQYDLRYIPSRDAWDFTESSRSDIRQYENSPYNG